MSSAKEILENSELFENVCKAAFVTVDTDNSGEIDANELSTVMKIFAAEANTPVPTQEEVDGILTALDSDKSGKISLDEFKVLIREVLKIMAGETEEAN